MEKPKVKIELGDDMNVEIKVLDDKYLTQDGLMVAFSSIAGAMANTILIKYGAEQAALFASGGIKSGSLVMAVAGETYLNGENLIEINAKRANRKKQTEPTYEYKEKKDDD